MVSLRMSRGAGVRSAALQCNGVRIATAYRCKTCARLRSDINLQKKAMLPPCESALIYDCLVQLGNMDYLALMAQLVERGFSKAKVLSSNLSGGITVF